MPSRRIPKDGDISASERRKLQGLYTTGPAAFGSIKNLIKASGLPRKTVLKFLHSNNAYTKFHGVNRKFPRLPVLPKFINEIWCADLAQVDKPAQQNDGTKYLLVTVDVLSRFVRVQPMKNKLAKTTKAAFLKMVGGGLQPKYLWVDQGKEFEGKFKTFCKNMNIHIYHTFSDKKAAYAERAIRSLKNILYRFLEERDTYRYLPKLQSFVQTLNSRFNRSTGIAPKHVSNRDVLGILTRSFFKRNLYKTPKYKIGDYVRISKQDIPFRKGYKPQFTTQIFKIVAIATRCPPTYRIQDKDGQVILGKFYENELIEYLI